LYRLAWHVVVVVVVAAAAAAAAAAAVYFNNVTNAHIACNSDKAATRIGTTIKI